METLANLDIKGFIFHNPEDSGSRGMFFVKWEFNNVNKALII